MTTVFLENFIVHPRNDLVSQQVSSGTQEHYELDNLLAHIKNNKFKSLVDIGANIGFHTIHYAYHNPTSTVHAFEPSQDNISVLEQNVNQYNLKNINIISSAVTGDKGTETLYGNEHNSGDTRIYKSDDYEPMETYDIDTVSLDDFFSDINIDYIKMDTQGCELEIFYGGAQVISEQKPDIFMEFWPWGYNQRTPDEKYINKFMEILTECRYELFEFSVNSPVITKVSGQNVYDYYRAMKLTNQHTNLFLLNSEKNCSSW